jgi:UDP:flavonoid glycosyltransferase YjiC (YdhE family)
VADKILITTIGSHGDINPFIAVALALQARGLRPLIATTAEHVERIRAAGIDAAPAGPSFADMAAAIGTGEDAVVRAVMRDPDFLIRHVLLSALAQTARDTIAAGEGARLVFGPPLAFAGRIAADALNVPFLPALLQPLMLMSARDPPRGQAFDWMKHAPVGAVGQTWNNAFIAVTRAEMKRRYNAAINAVRLGLGLQPRTRAPMFDDDNDVRLALFSPRLAAQGAPVKTHFTGFAWFDSESGAPEALDPAFQQFLRQGEPPIVFTLGSFAVYAPGEFYRASIEAARLLGKRCVLLTGPHTPTGVEPAKDMLICPFAPHSQVFPHAAIIVHHGGIGTTGQALRAGVPQLVVAHMGDQWDNGARVARLGVGETLSASRYGASIAAASLARMAKNSAMLSAARALGREVAHEDGGADSAEIIMRLLGRM